MTPAEIEKRRTAIRLQRKDLAKLAGLDPTTVNRTLTGQTRPLLETVQKLSGALSGEERRLAAYLHQERAA